MLKTRLAIQVSSKKVHKTIAGFVCLDVMQLVKSFSFTISSEQLNKWIGKNQQSFILIETIKGILMMMIIAVEECHCFNGKILVKIQGERVKVDVSFEMDRPWVRSRVVR